MTFSLKQVNDGLDLCSIGYARNILFKLYTSRAGVDNKSHWIEPNLPDLDRDMKEEVEIDFE